MFGSAQHFALGCGTAGTGLPAGTTLGMWALQVNLPLKKPGKIFPHHHILMISYSSTLHSQASSLSYSHMFNLKAGWRIKTGKKTPFHLQKHLQNPVFPSWKEHHLFQRLLGHYTQRCAKAAGRAARFSRPRLQCAALHEGAARTCSWERWIPRTPLKMANAELGEENRDRKGCSFIFWFPHAHTQGDNITLQERRCCCDAQVIVSCFRVHISCHARGNYCWMLKNKVKQKINNKKKNYKNPHQQKIAPKQTKSQEM